MVVKPWDAVCLFLFLAAVGCTGSVAVEPDSGHEAVQQDGEASEEGGDDAGVMQDAYEEEAVEAVQEEQDDGQDGGDATAGDDGGAETDEAEPPACGAPATFDDGLLPSNYLHVSPAGSDTDGDGSPGNPFATIEHAARRAAPGTSVVIHAGTYPGGNYLENLRGRPDAPIWIGGAEGEARPIISGGGEALHLVRPRYVVLHDIEVEGTNQNGINCDDGGDYADEEAARYVVFRNLDIHDVGGDGE
ncbi:MAG: hypothetical protein D6806_06015, partial [Deltaproteobacteria bacterium]